jgi:hypothetical protein
MFEKWKNNKTNEPEVVLCLTYTLFCVYKNFHDFNENGKYYWEKYLNEVLV